MLSPVELLNQCRLNIKEIDVETLSGVPVQTACIIDVREPGEFAQGRVPGSVNIPRGVLETQLCNHPMVIGTAEPLETLASKDIYLICRSGGRSALAAESMQKMGFKTVYSVAGGMLSWEKSGYQLEK
ncbi:MAG: rhodanese-like domain-containing protein [Algicola sp.]|nr:rhodanese-like domain-containing protein [Algicola sp.]